MILSYFLTKFGRVGGAGPTDSVFSGDRSRCCFLVGKRTLQLQEPAGVVAGRLLWEAAIRTSLEALEQNSGQLRVIIKDEVVG